MTIFEVGDDIEKCVMEFANLHSSHGEIVLLSADDDSDGGYHAIATLIRPN
jgi:hypothetical protein